MIEATVESIRASLATDHRVLILREVDGHRYVPIWIGTYEADAIALELQGRAPTRPLAWDLIRALLEELDATVESVAVSALRHRIFFATITITTSDKRSIELDARPSDAICLALRTGASILVDEAVMEDTGIEVTDESETETTPDFPTRTAPPVVEMGSSGEDEPTDLGVFRDFINSLDMEDFDKGSQQ